MSAVEFEPWPKIARLNRDIQITEKIDGTNAAVLIVAKDDLDHVCTPETGFWQLFDGDDRIAVAFTNNHVVFAQSRTRFVTPENDNYGFATWVRDNANTLVAELGPGRHFGEWWGSKIQSGYGMTNGRRFFSLFNATRWADVVFVTPNLRTVPVLYEGPFDQGEIERTIIDLNIDGSLAAECEGVTGAKAEGVVVWHTAARTSFKVTIEGDESPKGAAGHALDEEKK